MPGNRNKIRSQRDVIADACSASPRAGMRPYDWADFIIGKLLDAGWEFCKGMTSPQAFVLERDQDVSGVSGVGTVAEGVVFSDGTVSLRWTSDWPTSVVFHDKGIESVQAVPAVQRRMEIIWSSEPLAGLMLWEGFPQRRHWAATEATGWWEA